MKQLHCHVSRIPRQNRYRLACAACRAPMPVALVRISSEVGDFEPACQGCLLSFVQKLMATIEDELSSPECDECGAAPGGHFIGCPRTGAVKLQL